MYQQTADRPQLPPSWKPKPGDTLTGTVINYDSAPDRFRPGQEVEVCIVRPDNADPVSVWINHVYLRAIFRKWRPLIGTRVTFTRLDDAPPKQEGFRPCARYRVSKEGKGERETMSRNQRAPSTRPRTPLGPPPPSRWIPTGPPKPKSDDMPF